MYRLLIVTPDQSVNDAVSAMQGWEKYGCKPPRVRMTAEEAIECMQTLPIDAVAVDAQPCMEGLLNELDEKYPDMPMFRVVTDEAQMMQNVQEVSRLLNRLKADDSNDRYDFEANLQQQRDRWFKKLLSGMVNTEDDLQRQMQLYRFKADTTLPCVVARLEMSDEDGFMSVRWHYGSDRLETALRNFFGQEYNHMRIRVAVISPEEVRVLCYPAEAQFAVSENIAHDYIQETVEQIENYLGLHMTVTSVCRIAGIRELCANY